MDLAKYTELTGIIVSTSQATRVTAQIKRSQKILESMLGFTLDITKVNTNEYIEIGKTKTECPCIESININNLNPADAVIYAYRLFNYNKNDKYFFIDPATAINKIKLVVDGVTVKTLVEFEDYRLDYKQGIVKFIEKITNWCSEYFNCEHVQLAVDANWVWANVANIPDDLNYVWTDMITFYSDSKNNIKSESLGPHSYTKFDNTLLELFKQNLPIIKKYSGPNGSVNRLITN